ncbi:MAG: RNA 3'-terminal phosphate cyclase [Thermoproteales archaeon]|nr:RNA 3'-terminal phosphate cyclase [Thermoproteales archaeon]
MLEIDGSYGEGGGQLLRYSVALAALLRKSVRIFNIRAKRSNPGLRPQHLNAVKTIVELVNGDVQGLKIGSTSITIKPRSRPRVSTYRVDIGTAGSISLLLQATLPVLLAAEKSIKMIIRGGTTVKWSPPIPYFQNVLLPNLQKFGVKASIKLVRRGFYPKGGGEVEVEVFPSYPLRSTKFDFFTAIKEINILSYVGNLPKHIAERQARAAIEVLRREGFNNKISKVIIDYKTPSTSKGTGILVWAVTDEGIVGGDSIGEIGKRAEIVGKEAAEKIVKVLKTGASIDPHALDNIVIYMALAEGSSMAISSELTSHAKTAMDLCSWITGASFSYEVKDKWVKIRGLGIGFKPQ